MHRLLLAVVTLASAMTAFSDSALPVGAPMFEIDGRMVAAEVVRWESSGENRELGSGIVELVESGVLRDFPAARLTRRIRRAAALRVSPCFGRDCLLRPLKLAEAALDARIHLRRADQSAIAWRQKSPLKTRKKI